MPFPLRHAVLGIDADHMTIHSNIQRLLGIPFTWRQRRLLDTRAPLDEAAFVDQVVAGGGDRAAAASLWARLRDWIYVEGFTPYPCDDLEHVYGIAEEELDEELVLGL